MLVELIEQSSFFGIKVSTVLEFGEITQGVLSGLSGLLKMSALIYVLYSRAGYIATSMVLQFFLTINIFLNTFHTYFIPNII